MPEDKWGNKRFYPLKTDGFTYEQSDDITNDGEFNGEGHVTNSSGGFFTMTTHGPDAVQLGKNTTSADAIGGCKMNFAEAALRDYIYKADDPRDIELKFWVKFVSSGSDNGFAVEGPTANHSSSGCCQGFSYKVDIQYRPNIPEFRFRKEMWHVSNSDEPTTGPFTSPIANFQLLGHSTYVGVGYCRYNKANGAKPGHNTKDSVILEFWFNPNPETDPKNWVLIKQVEDKGGWGGDGDKCGGDKDQIGSWSGPKFRLKSNDVDGVFQMGHLSLFEIDPTKSFDEDQNTPPPGGQPDETTEVKGFLMLKTDLNVYRVSACQGAGGGGGGGGSSKFYTVYTDQGTDSDKELSDSSTFQNRKRITMSPANNSSIFKGKTPHQLDIPLKKNGSPGASPTVGAKIWDSAGNVVYTSPTTLDPSTLTTSYVSKTFDFSTNTHSLVQGDRIGVEYTGTSSSNYVIASYIGTAYANTTYEQYEGTTWQSKSRRLVMDVWE